MLLQTALNALLLTAATFTSAAEIPPRYTNPDNAAFLFGLRERYAFVQAINGELIVTPHHPTDICPCPDPAETYGAGNLTGYYIGGTRRRPTLQLYTSGEEQRVYISHKDLSFRYTRPGKRLPRGASGHAIRLFDPLPLGSGLPSTSIMEVEGMMKGPDGERFYLKGFEFCNKNPDKEKPPRQNGIGPYRIFATRTADGTPDGERVISEGCVEGYLESSIQFSETDPGVAYHAPSEPLAYAYAN